MPSNRALYSRFGVVTTAVRGPRGPEQRPREAGEPDGVEVLDHLHHRGGVEPGEAAVAVGERRLHEVDPLALGGRHPVEAQPAGGGLERAVGDVGADDLA